MHPGMSAVRIAFDTRAGTYKRKLLTKAGEVQNVSSVLVAVGINSEGYREILGVAEGSREDKES